MRSEGLTKSLLYNAIKETKCCHLIQLPVVLCVCAAAGGFRFVFLCWSELWRPSWVSSEATAGEAAASDAPFNRAAGGHMWVLALCQSPF